MRIVALILFILSVLLFFGGLGTVSNSPDADQGSSYAMGYYLGAFMPALICLVLAMFLNGKAKGR